MSEERGISRRTFVKAGAAGLGLVATACAPKVVEKVVKETVVVEKEVEKVVKETIVVKEAVEVEKEVTRVIEKAVQPAEQPVVLRLHMRAGGEVSEAPIYVTRPTEFTEETGIQVQLEPIPGGEYMAKLEILAVSGDLGDNTFTTQASWHHSRLVHFAILLPMNEWMDSAGIKREEWIPSGIDSCTFGGNVYGLPKTAHPAEAYVWLNHSLFEEAGIPVPELDLEAEKQGKAMSWDQLREWASKMAKGPTNAREVYGFYPVTTNSQAVVNGIRSFGGWELDEEGKEHPVDTWRDYVLWNHNALYKEKFSPHSTELGAGGIYGLFAASKLAVMQGGCWYYRGVEEAVGPPEGGGAFAWSIVGLPQGPDFKGWGASMNSHAPTRQSQHPVEACMLQYALADARFSQIIARDLHYLVGRTNEMEEIGELAEDPFLQLQWVMHFRAAPYRVGRNYRGEEWRSAMTNTLDEVYLGVREPDDSFFGYAKEALDEILQRPIS
ncbi:MAG: extracellular solute-binding protein [Anaerolineae bacterium]|nr:extracellular solute-binding protein [Anaerolineae bacterium]